MFVSAFGWMKKEKEKKKTTNGTSTKSSKTEVYLSRTADSKLI